MPLPKKALRIASALLGVLTVIALAAALFHFRPLIRSRAYQATVETPGGGAVKAAVYSMLGRPDWIFVKVPESHRDPERPIYRWFVWDTSTKVVSLSWVRETPFLHRNHDQARGIDILDAKMEDRWRLEYSRSSVRFTNERLTITIQHDSGDDQH